MLVNLFFFTHVAKYLKYNEHNGLYFAQKHAGMFVLGYIICSSKLTVSRILEQIMSADKYL